VQNRFHLLTRTGHPDFLDLPWERPLEEWRSERLVEVVRGIGRHVVRFVEYEGRIYALKELPRRFAEREYRLLRHLEVNNVPVVEVVGIANERPDDLDPVLITRHLEFSLPYRSLFGSRGIDDLRASLVGALAELLVRLHLEGFFWGDCSLSNTLFRRDAGSLSAYLVDAETAELHPQLTDGQRRHDLDIAEQNIVGELLDVEADTGLPQEIDSIEVAQSLRSSYEPLWTELTREEVFSAEERYRIDERLRRLNELGFDVEEMELVSDGDGYRLRLDPHVVEPGHHRRRLLMLTGLHAQENQARRMLNDLASFRAHLERTGGRPLPESVVAYRWLSEVFEPTVAAVPEELHGKLEAAEVFHQVLEHRWYLSETGERDVGAVEAARSYVEHVLRHVPDERRLLPRAGDVDTAGSDIASET
jgi:hypothetical protein